MTLGTLDWSPVDQQQQKFTVWVILRHSGNWTHTCLHGSQVSETWQSMTMNNKSWSRNHEWVIPKWNTILANSASAEFLWFIFPGYLTRWQGHLILGVRRNQSLYCHIVTRWPFFISVEMIKSFMLFFGKTKTMTFERGLHFRGALKTTPRYQDTWWWGQEVNWCVGRVTPTISHCKESFPKGTCHPTARFQFTGCKQLTPRPWPDWLNSWCLQGPAWQQPLNTVLKEVDNNTF